MTDWTPLPSLVAAINSDINTVAKGMYGGEAFNPFKEKCLAHTSESLKDLIVESFAGTHDVMGGQMGGGYMMN